jgi:coenzyme F420 hydrogenase subunit delta
MQEITNEEQSLLAENSGDPSDLEALAGFCHPPLSRRTAVIGVGNRLWGDDGAGPELLKRLKEEWEGRETHLDSQGRILFIDAGDSPEDCLIRVVDFKPDLVLAIDAVDLQAEPGSIAVLQSEAIPEAFCCSTHRLPLRTIIQLWESSGTKTLVLGIQPKDVIFRDGLSPEVKMSIETLAQFFSRQPCKE